MSKSHFYKVVLLGVSLWIVAQEASIFVSKIIEFFIRLTPLPEGFNTGVQVMFQLGMLLAVGFLAYVLYQDKYNDIKWISKAIMLQLILFISLSGINTIWNLVGYTGLSNGRFHFNFWMIRGIIVDVMLFAGLLILAVNLKDEATSGSTSVNYMKSETNIRPTGSSAKTPPDLPS